MTSKRPKQSWFQYAIPEVLQRLSPAQTASGLCPVTDWIPNRTGGLRCVKLGLACEVVPLALDVQQVALVAARGKCCGGCCGLEAQVLCDEGKLILSLDVAALRIESVQCRVAPSGAMWVRPVPSGAVWGRREPSGAVWVRPVPSGAVWRGCERVGLPLRCTTTW